jgi:molecular chaperone GrpE (heat shock protein)
MHHSIQRRLICLSIAATMAISSMPPVFATEDASTLSNQITQIQKQVDAQAKELSRINAELTNNSKELALAKSAMSDRVRAMYMYGTDGYWQYLFSSKNVSDFFTNADQVTNVVRADRDKIRKIETLEASLKAEQKEAKATQDELNKKLKEVQKKLQQYASTGHKTEVTDQMDFICAVVASECNVSYEGALAVISCVMNRVDSGVWGGKDAVSVLTAPGQFAGYLDGPYKRYLNGHYPPYVKQAVTDCMTKGIRNHKYQSFRAGSSYGVWNCGGNSYR